MITANPKIRLVYDPTKPDGPWFMSDDPTQYPKPSAQAKKIKVKHGDDAVITFSIETSGIKFHPDKPFDIRPMDSNKPYDLSQFEVTKNNGNKLEITDKNTDNDQTEYYYQLNFEGDTKPLDPIIQNGCCRSVPPDDGGGLPH